MTQKFSTPRCLAPTLARTPTCVSNMSLTFVNPALLQRAHNAAVRLMSRLSPRDHVISTLQDLHCTNRSLINFAYQCTTPVPAGHHLILQTFHSNGRNQLKAITSVRQKSSVRKTLTKTRRSSANSPFLTRNNCL